MSPSLRSDSPEMSHPPKPSSTSTSRTCLQRRSKRFWMILAAVLVALALGLAVGLGVGLTKKGSGNTSPSEPTSTPPPSNNTNNGTLWTPSAGTTWQIVLQGALASNDPSLNVTVMDIDLFDNDASTITALHSQNRKVICYFSAGSYENWRSDSGQFKKSDYGKALQGWDGEYWLNTSSANVRQIMRARLALAASKKCDGVDPDNLDAYNNENGLDMTAADAEDYVAFLSREAHSLNLSIGLKNAGEIVNATVDMMEWVVNEQCVEYKECALYQPFIAAGKPVFHIEYPSSAPSVSTSQKTAICGDASTQGFSTIIKGMDLKSWYQLC
ncbi:glycoside hydrolase superfamily [Amylocarpus encephaloides]|uniref:alpha-galactosidase n=1 Tax=Amylocarpus encephaloides TaxID=45428 RepID=A0A9P7YEC2_9HELO|nr:glycoside hydrolase superfamily [Amylocarpus encephaloides]